MSMVPKNYLKPILRNPRIARAKTFAKRHTGEKMEKLNPLLISPLPIYDRPSLPKMEKGRACYGIGHNAICLLPPQNFGIVPSFHIC